MILLTIVAVGLLGLATVELRKSNSSEARSIALSNAKMGLMLALGQLQNELGDDRRITADASVLAATKNPSAVGVWNGWSPDLALKSGSSAAPRVDYKGPKSQTGFRSWLVSSTDPAKIRQLTWHAADPATNTNNAVPSLFTDTTSGFNLSGEKIPFSSGLKPGSVAWAVTQENTKARINLGTNDAKRISLEDRMQTPSRPNLALSAYFKQPTGDWSRKPATICDLSQAVLDSSYAATRDGAAKAAKDYTVHSLSLLTNPVKGGLKVDLTTGFDMSDTEFAADSWPNPAGTVKNPFRATTPREYKGQKPLYQPMVNSAQAQVLMNFAPASVNHKYQVNGVPTYNTLRSYYRTYRNLYNVSGSGTTAFERPYSHIATPDLVTGRPFGQKTQSSLAPVVDRVSIMFSIYAKADGTLGILLTPFVTVWNPHNVDIETEGLVVYPWIDFAVFWKWNVTSKADGSVKTWDSSLSRIIGEGYQDGGRSSRPYFYLHLTQSGNAPSPGAKAISPAIHLEPGEVRVFCLADTTRRDLETLQGPAARTWRMRPVGSATDITASLKGGIVLNMTKSIGGNSSFNYKLKAGDTVNANQVSFDRSTYIYVMNMADSWQIKNPNTELMVEARGAYGSLPALPAEKNLYFYDQVHSSQASGKGNDYFSYPAYRYEEINETPKLVGSLLTYHRVAMSSTLPLADLMFTTNPRQPFINQYLSGGQFQTGPHYESLLQGGTSLSQLAMETTFDGRKAFYGPSQSASTGRSNLAFFEIPRSPTLSLGSFQHCDITATAFGCASQIANSWASPYVAASSVSKLVATAPNGEAITPALGVYDSSYLANEALFDSTYLSGAAPHFGSRKTNTGSPAVWDSDQITEDQPSSQVLQNFFADPIANPLRNPRMTPYQGGLSATQIKDRMSGPSRCVVLAANLMVEGGFNINSTSEEAWTAVLASLRGADPASADKTAQSRFRHILSGAPANMAENDPWSGFRTLSDADLKLLAKNLVSEIKNRGPFLSLGEFVNRRISTDRVINLSGALQSAIDASGLNRKYGYSNFATTAYPNPENIPNPNTGTNTPGWLSQADILHGLAPYVTARSDTFTIRSLGEAKNAEGKITATVRLEAVVQRVPDWVDPVDDAATDMTSLKSVINKTFGRKFQIVSIREIVQNPSGNPV